MIRRERGIIIIITGAAGMRLIPEILGLVPDKSLEGTYVSIDNKPINTLTINRVSGLLDVPRVIVDKEPPFNHVKFLQTCSKNRKRRKRLKRHKRR